MVATLAEQGMKDFDVAVWHGVYAPKGMPKALPLAPAPARHRVAITALVLRHAQPVLFVRGVAHCRYRHITQELEAFDKSTLCEGAPVHCFSAGLPLQ